MNAADIDIETDALLLGVLTRDSRARKICTVIVRDYNFRRLRRRILAKMAEDQLEGMGMTD